jgi:large subunit ribosomal protein L18
VRKSLRHLYAQLVDDQTGHVLASASTLDPAVRGEVHGRNAEAAEKVGALLAARAAEKGIEYAVFDRGGHPYHGVVAALADACRKGGLRF